MAQRSELIPIPNVTTVVDALEIKKERNRIAFGDQEDLNKISDIRKSRSDPEFTQGQTRVHNQDRYFTDGIYSVSMLNYSDSCFGSVDDQDHHFNDGNYSVSVLNYSGKKPVVVIHQENVDPCVMEQTMQLSTATIVVSATGSFFGPSQWFSSRRTRLASSGKRKRNRVLAWKSADEEMSDGFNRKNEIDLTGLLYFVSDLYFDHDQIEIVYSSDGVYKLTVNNTKIGFAINLAEIFWIFAEMFAGILFQDPDSGCFALAVWSSDEVGTSRTDSKDDDELVLPMSWCLYDNVYRSFYNNGDNIDNPYYGPNGVADFDFTRLPDHIFLKIFLHLPLQQRVHCRRISQRWLSMANTALAVDTKTVNTYKKFYSKMTPDQLKSFLPLVSNCLEELTLSRRLVSEITLDTFSSIITFSSLTRLHFVQYFTYNEAALFYVLDRSPKLKVLDAWIPEEFPMPYDTHGPYPVEKLSLTGECSTDSRLVAFLECFPDVINLSITGMGSFTASCISWVMEKYGSKLCLFEFDIDDYDEFPSYPPFGAVTGIQTCSNLRHLLLNDTKLVSDVLMGALAAGCHKLESLNFHCSGEVTNGGLATLATLPNLTELVICNWSDQPDFSEGVTAIAREGRLIAFEVLVPEVGLSAACLKTIVRCCRHLRILEVDSNDARLTMEDAAEIVRLYGIRSMEPNFEFRSNDPIWKNDNVRAVVKEIKESHQREFRIIIR